MTNSGLLKNHNVEAKVFASRMILAVVGAFLLLLLLFYNLYYLQVSNYQKYQTRSNENRIKVLPIAPNRGRIFDRNGVLLADNTPVYSLEMIPEQVKDIDNTLAQLQDLLGLSDEDITRAQKKIKGKRRFKAVEVKGRLSELDLARFSVQQHKFPGVFVDARLRRDYPFAELTTHALGYVGRINQQDLVKLDQEGIAGNYAATRNIGKLGIEKFYQQELHGSIGNEKVEINNQGRVIRTLDYTPPVPGKDLTLTLDIELQMIAKRALTGKRGAVVAIDPRDGALLAMYSNPSYDPNPFVHGISSRDYKKLLSKERPLLNRVTQGVYPPASTIKPFLGLTGLAHGVITEHSQVNDPGWYQLKNVKRKFRDHISWGHGKIDLHRALMKSCNTYFYHLAFELGINDIADMMERFGFGETTGIDIFEEYQAVLPSRYWKRSQYNQPWYQGDTINIGIGQGFWAVTPLQLAQATSVLVNRGEVKTPHLLMSRQGATTGSERQSQPGFSGGGTVNHALEEERPPMSLVKAKHWDIILNAMHDTVQVKGGTGYNAFKGSFYDAAGKSGTAELVGLDENQKYEDIKSREHLRDNAMFIAYAPFDNPEIVVAVALENSGHGGVSAGPVARQVMDQYFAHRSFISQADARAGKQGK
ncbi:penicillin-binding protein 2 [Thalassomonas haliotis]|uniref:Peptidoglycan D,D-transpeptidase MrdA n=1 Tax=Thalassomonas haliotis TaxID=485448 RepID=A0ABY7V9C6_9GAMM|nr:penicillin-binding protein 2 [Thalassomonas haliotis]WDE10249.1 penicillin-binding protein 2 [Thalassomonas haliotis]